VTSTEALASRRFQPGDHVRVRRSVGYWHHGIYETDDHVIQFDSRVLYKPRATIEAVSQSRFGDGAPVEVVSHPRCSQFGPWLPAPDPSETIIRRDEWPLANHPVHLYDLVGWNYEHAAN
jgi:hypothetical protein